MGPNKAFYALLANRILELTSARVYIIVIITMNIVQVAKYIGYSYALLTLVACVYFYQANKDSSDLATALLVTLIPQLAIAYGIVNAKLWGVYGLGLIAVLTLITMFLNVYLGKEFDSVSAGYFIVFGLLFFWLFSSRSKFS